MDYLRKECQAKDQQLYNYNMQIMEQANQASSDEDARIRILEEEIRSLHEIIERELNKKSGPNIEDYQRNEDLLRQQI